MEGELTCQFDGQAPSKFHVILRGLKIYFYPSKSAVQYTKAILLTSCNLDQSRAMDDRSFVLQETSENFTTTLSASSSAERDKWLSALEGSFVVIRQMQSASRGRGGGSSGAGGSSGDGRGGDSALQALVRGSGKFQRNNTLVMRDYKHHFGFECPEHWEYTMEMADDTQDRHDVCIVTMGDEYSAQSTQSPGFWFVDVKDRQLPDGQEDTSFPESMEALLRMCRFVVEAESGDVEPLPEYEKSGRQVIHGNEFCRVAWKATNLPEEDGDVEILYLFWGIIRGSKAYLIAFKGNTEAFSVHLNEAERIMETFVFLDEGSCWCPVEGDVSEAVRRFELTSSVRYINKLEGFSLMAPTAFDKSTWRISFVAPLLVSFHVIVPDEEESEDRLIIANVQVLKEKIEDGEEGVTDPDSYAETSRSGILALGNEKIAAHGHNIEKCKMGGMDARKFLTTLEYKNDAGEITRSQYLLTFTLLQGGCAWILQFSSTEESAMKVFMPVVENFVLPSFRLL